MIRVTTINGDGSPVTVRVEGSLRSSNVEQVRRACGLVAMPGRAVTLDLSGVTFVDAAGAECIRELRDGGAALTGCRGLVEEMLREPHG